MKNDETLLIRLPSELKSEFEQLCNREATDMSSKARTQIAQIINGEKYRHEKYEKQRLLAKSLDQLHIYHYGLSDRECHSGKDVIFSEKYIVGILKNHEDIGGIKYILIHEDEIGKLYELEEEGPKQTPLVSYMNSNLKRGKLLLDGKIFNIFYNDIFGMKSLTNFKFIIDVNYNGLRNEEWEKSTTGITTCSLITSDGVVEFQSPTIRTVYPEWFKEEEEKYESLKEAKKLAFVKLMEFQWHTVIKDEPYQESQYFH